MAGALTKADDRGKYDGVNAAISDVNNALADQAKGGDEAQAAKETLDAADKTTIATVKAHQEDLRKTTIFRKKQWNRREQQLARSAGRRPDPKALEGKWVADLDATVALNLPVDDPAVKEQMRKSMAELIHSATYTFGPGDKMVATTERAGTASSEEGAYRLDGSKLFIKGKKQQARTGTEHRPERKRPPHWMMGVFTVFHKQP